MKLLTSRVCDVPRGYSQLEMGFKLVFRPLSIQCDSPYLGQGLTQDELCLMLLPSPAQQYQAHTMRLGFYMGALSQRRGQFG